MNINQIKNKISTSDEYLFLKDNAHLNNYIVLLSLGGSYAYGTNKEDSDIDLRGIALNNKEEILLGKDFEQVVETNTDTTIYSINKILELLSKSNPNTIEILGCKPEHYIVLSPIGKELLKNRKMFLSKICIYTFAGYASSQLRRLENKAARLVGQAENEAHILKSIQNASYDFKNRYFPYTDDQINLYIGKSDRDDMDSEIYMDIHLTHYPLRDWCGLWNEQKAIVSSYNKMGKRNKNAISRDKLGKHMAHLIRLYMTCIDILEKEEIITYREAEHDLLMDIRNGEFLDDNRQLTSDFFDILNEYEKKFEYAKSNTSLPDVPDYKKINEFKIWVNEQIVKGEV